MGELHAAIQTFGEWILSGACQVQDRDHGANMIPLSPTPSQRRLVRTIRLQAEAGRPVRVIVPKFRRGGISTISECLAVKLCSLLPNRLATTLAHTKADTLDIFRLAKIANASLQQPGEARSSAIEWPNGSIYDCRTAGTRGVKRGGGTHYLHVTELAYLETVSGLDADAITALVNTVPDDPESIIILEGTGSGPVGEFWRRTMDAQKGAGSFELCFLPWYDDTRNSRKADNFGSWTDADRDMQVAFSLSDEQVAWYAHKRADQKDPSAMRREYPTTVDDCFSVAEGRVYPTFSRQEHVRTIEIGRHWQRYRAIDWGWTQGHPFVCLWVAHDPSAMPQLVIDPSCEDVIRQFIGYHRDGKTGEPVKAEDDAPDALRYLITTMHLHGLVYVYRALVHRDAAQLGTPGLAREVHRLSGWVLPDGANELDIRLHQPGPAGETFILSVADKANIGAVSDFRDRYGIPTIPYEEPSDSRNRGEKGPVEAGITIVSDLILAGAVWRSPVIDPDKAAVDEARNNPDRNIFLTPRQTERYYEDNRLQPQSVGSLVDETLGDN